jgi:hypothetical protein
MTRQCRMRDPAMLVRRSFRHNAVQVASEVGVLGHTGRRDGLARTTRQTHCWEYPPTGTPTNWSRWTQLLQRADEPAVSK